MNPPFKPQKAVALKYDKEKKEGAPKVVAKGAGEVANNIIKLAQEHDIFIKKDAEVDSSIFFNALWQFNAKLYVIIFVSFEYQHF